MEIEMKQKQEQPKTATETETEAKLSRVGRMHANHKKVVGWEKERNQERKCVQIARTIRKKKQKKRKPSKKTKAPGSTPHAGEGKKIYTFLPSPPIAMMEGMGRFCSPVE